MEEWRSYFHQTKPISDLITNATIVVDTNVLLSAYQWRDVTVQEVLKVLKQLSDQDRLRIPLQVIKEFSDNRPKQIITRINDVEELISRLQKQAPLKQKVPMLEGKKVFEKASAKLTQLNTVLDEYKKELLKVRDEVKSLFTYDPYLNEIKLILKKSYYELPITAKSQEEILKEAERRNKYNIPPGFLDGAKQENSEGDYIIWYSMLQLESDVIFISGDKKSDWVYTDKKGESVSARRELVEEFYKETGGHDFLHITPKEFITMFNPGLSDDIKDDLSIESKNIVSESITFTYHLQERLEHYDPLNKFVSQNDFIIDYASEAIQITAALYRINNIDDLANEIRTSLERTAAFDVTKLDFYDSMISDIFKLCKEFNKI